MLVLIQDWETSTKASFIVKLLKKDSNPNVFYITHGMTPSFSQNWNGVRIELASSLGSILTYYAGAFLKSPSDMRDGLMKRLFHRHQAHVLVHNGFFSSLSQALLLYFARTAKREDLLKALNEIREPKVFLVDEFVNSKILDVNQLKQMGKVVYVSQDLGYNCYGFAGNRVTRQLMYKLEQETILKADLVVACSERDKISYLKMGAKNVVCYPNIYPNQNLQLEAKNQQPAISIVLRGHWGAGVDKSLTEILEAIACLRRKVTVYMIGIKPEHVPRNVVLHHFYDNLPRKEDYLKILSKSWIGINVGVHKGGTNQRKYDYSITGLVVISDKLGVRGDLLPYEYSYLDSHDLAGKIEQLLEFGRDRLVEMGTENQKYVLALAEKRKTELLKAIKNIK